MVKSEEPARACALVSSTVSFAYFQEFYELWLCREDSRFFVEKIDLRLADVVPQASTFLFTFREDQLPLFKHMLIATPLPFILKVHIPPNETSQKLEIISLV